VGWTTSMKGALKSSRQQQWKRNNIQNGNRQHLSSVNVFAKRKKRVKNASFVKNHVVTSERERLFASCCLLTGSTNDTFHIQSTKYVLVDMYITIRIIYNFCIVANEQHVFGSCLSKQIFEMSFVSRNLIWRTTKKRITLLLVFYSSGSVDSDWCCIYVWVDCSQRSCHDHNST
jgi:hypothetical protein